MNKKIDIKNIAKRNPYKVPKDYFLTLSQNIMYDVDSPKKESIISFSRLKTIAPALVIVILIFSGVWYNNQNTNLTDEDLVELLAFYDVEEDLILEYIDLEKEETTDEYLMEHFNYNELIYEL
ncbi:MAG: hypothetical protein H8E84_02960 [Flavobacteriales bacterium]|nr:hypothetical protein [Flavobacteriales bacterium]